MRGEREVGLDQPFEFQEWLVVEYDVVDVAQRDAAGFEAIGKRAARKSGVILPATETLLLGGSHDPAILDQGGRAVVIERGNPDYVHTHRCLLRRRCR